MRTLVARITAFFRKRDLDRDLDQELAVHLELATEDNIRRGLSPEEARRDALIRFGGVEAAREHHRDARGLPGSIRFFTIFATRFEPCAATRPSPPSPC
jgi:hypothetical protein